VARESLDTMIVNLRNGPFAPGATAEADGTAEIEISLEEGPGTVLSVIASSAADHIELGALGGGRYGVNLNAAVESSPDADVTARNTSVFLSLGSGSDRVDPRGRTAFAAGPFGRPFLAEGAAGRDVLIGNDRLNALNGGGGRDRLVGNGGGDVLLGRAGRDRIEARDQHRDKIDCGAGKDTVRADRVDRRQSCE
jgi:Ca2+-binding RTX toxin-like protein